MKKFNVLICVLLVLFSLTACGNTAKVSENVTTTEQTTALTTVLTSTTVSESSSVAASETTTTTETTTATTTEVTTSVVTTEATTAYTTTEATTKVTTTEPTTRKTVAIKSTTVKPTTSENQTTTNETTTKLSTTKPITTKPFTTKATTTKSTTTEKQTTTIATTKPVVTTKPTTTNPTTTVPTTQTTASAKKYCTVRIECNTIYDNIGKFKSGKHAFLPVSGVILDDVQVELNGGESAFDVIKKACEENACTDNCKYCKASGVQIEYTYTPAFNNYYIEGIHQIYEKDCGTQSGWMYSVNGVFPDVGTSSYTVSPDDVIVFSFTCNMGEDIGNYY